MPRLKVLILSLATLCASAFGQNANPAQPGTINYVEGQASIDGRALSPNSVGHVELNAGQSLSTASGKVEILLTPGIFLRLGDNSTVQIVSPSLTPTEVRLDRGHANIEVDQLYQQNVILIDLQNRQTRLLKRGLYVFNADNATVRVFDGEAVAYSGENFNVQVNPIRVKAGHQLVIADEPTEPEKFDKKQAKDGDLYKWSSLRSEYLGEANVDLASEYAGAADFYPGWYWAGGPFGYTWLPGDGLFWNPYGFGFYSPYYIYGGGPIYGGYGRGYYRYSGGRGYHGGGSFHGGTGGGFHGGGSGSFHGGGGGGFHGGGGGGGGHR